MSMQIGVGIGIACAVLLWMSMRGPSLLKLVREAIDANDPKGLLDAAKELSGKQRSFFYQQAIQSLWNGYHRVLAAHMILAFAQDCPEEKICQYWLRQLQELEPEIAAEMMDESFLERHYQPEVAACCGVASS